MSSAVDLPSLSSASVGATGNPGLGILGTLPRELRDEIYRHLVKVCCKAMWQSNLFAPRCAFEAHTVDDRVFEREMYCHTPETTVFRLSKAINHEATAVYYSESTFIGFIDALKRIVSPPQLQLDRMMNVELYVMINMENMYSYCYGGDPWARQEKNVDGWDMMVQKIGGTALTRKTILIAFQIDCLTTPPELPTQILYHLHMFVNNHTVVIDVTLILHKENVTINVESCSEELDAMIEDVKENLEPIMGPTIADLSPTVTVDPGQAALCRRLEFHPQKFSAKKSDI